MIPDLARIAVEPPCLFDLNRVDWNELSANPAAIDVLLEHPERINWQKLSENPAAIELLRANLDRVDWFWHVRVIASTPRAYLLGSAQWKPRSN